jgi:hypothetical protein
LYLLKVLGLIQAVIQALADQGDTFLFGKVTSYNEQSSTPTSLFMQVSRLGGLPWLLSAVSKAMESSTQLSLTTIAELALQVLTLFLRVDLVPA